MRIKAAIEQALAHDDKPTLICCRTTIGFGSPNKAGKESSHGAALGKDEVEATRKALGWEYGPFEIPQDIRDGWRAGNAGLVREEQWNRMFDEYAARHPDLAEELIRRSHAELPEGFAAAADAYVAKLQAEGPVVASRKASQMAIEAFAPLLPELVGGSADLAHSNLTLWKGSKSVATDDADANYIYFGVREFAMTAISNGLALHGGFIPYDATFLVFSDYARNAVRMSALMGAHAIHVYTHDSIGLGEDGPTHQPVEHLASLRYIPHNDVWRPCDAVESAVSLARRDRAHATARAAWCSRARTSPTRRASEAQVADDRARRLRVEGQRRRAGTDPDRHRLRSRPGDGRGRATRRQGARGVDAVAPTCSTARMPRIANRCCRTPAASASPSKPASPISGASTSASMARWSASTASAPAPRSRR